MIRKTAILLLALVLIGCGSTNDQAAGTTSQAAAQEAAAADSEGTAQQGEENGGAASETGKTGSEAAAAAPEKKTVTIVIPTVYESVRTQEEADEICKRTDMSARSFSMTAASGSR